MPGGEDGSVLTQSPLSCAKAEVSEGGAGIVAAELSGEEKLPDLCVCSPVSPALASGSSSCAVRRDRHVTLSQTRKRGLHEGDDFLGATELDGARATCRVPLSHPPPNPTI